jgi:pimeloyl-ACP methyl ester carboxylesterase
MPETIVLIHGLWMTPLSWEHWSERFAAAGHQVLAPAWPGMEDRTVESLRADTTAYQRLGVTEIADHYDGIIRKLERPALIMGHSFGGLVTQILLDRGLGAAGVAIHPAPPRGIYVTPPSSLRVAFAALRSPANRHRAVMLSERQFHYAFCNTQSEAESKVVYDRYAVPGPGRTLFQAGLANFNPGAATKIDFHNGTRAALLILGGGEDHTVPAATTRRNYKLQSKSAAVTEYREYPDRSHYTVGLEGWEAVADHALEWAVAQAAKRAVAH